MKAATQSKKPAGAKLNGAAHDEVIDVTPRAKDIAGMVAEALTIGLGIAATSAVANMLLTALTISIGAFLAMAIAIAFAIMALTATFMAGGVVRQAVNNGVLGDWGDRMRVMFRHRRFVREG